MTNAAAAKRYARALLDVAVKEHVDLQQIERELGEFVALFEANPALAKAMYNPAVPMPRKRAAMAEIIAHAKAQPTLAKLIALLAERDRLVLLPEVAAAYRDRLLDHMKVVRAEVTTAVPLADDRAKAIQQSLAHVTGRTVILSSRVDPAIIGGVVARIGSTVYDGSVTRQLEKMKERLIEGA